MNGVLTYLLITSVCTGVLYLCFRLLMKKEAAFALNRATLLSIVLLPLVIPFVPLPANLHIAGAGRQIIKADGQPKTAEPAQPENSILSDEYTPATSERSISPTAEKTVTASFRTPSTTQILFWIM